MYWQSVESLSYTVILCIMCRCFTGGKAATPTMSQLARWSKREAIFPCHLPPLRSYEKNTYLYVSYESRRVKYENSPKVESLWISPRRRRQQTIHNKHGYKNVALNMKFAAAISLLFVASASAFAPVPAGRVSQASSPFELFWHDTSREMWSVPFPLWESSSC